MPERDKTGVSRPEITIRNQALPTRMLGQNRDGKDGSLLTEPDRTLRNWALQVLRRTSGGASEVVALAEDDGSPLVVLYGKDSSSNIDPLRTNSDQQLQVQMLGADSGGNNDVLRTNGDQQLQVQLVGSDEASNNDAVRTDPNRVLWNRPYDGYVQVDPVGITGSEAIVYNPGSTAAELYEVSFKVINESTSSTVLVDVGVDIGGGGGLAAGEYWLRNRTLQTAGTIDTNHGRSTDETEWRTFLMAGDDDVRAVADAADRAVIHFKIRRVDTGA